MNFENFQKIFKESLSFHHFRQYCLSKYFRLEWADRFEFSEFCFSLLSLHSNIVIWKEFKKNSVKFPFLRKDFILIHQQSDFSKGKFHRHHFAKQFTWKHWYRYNAELTLARTRKHLHPFLLNLWPILPTFGFKIEI